MDKNFVQVWSPQVIHANACLGAWHSICINGSWSMLRKDSTFKARADAEKAIANAIKSNERDKDGRIVRWRILTRYVTPWELDAEAEVLAP